MPQDDERLVAVENAAGRLFAAHGYPQIAEDGFEDAAQLRSTLSGGDIFVAVVVVTIVGRRRSRREAVESIEILPLRSIIAKLEQI